MVYAKPPFSGPEAVLTYLSRYNAPDICYLRFLDAGAQVGCQPKHDIRLDVPGPAKRTFMLMALDDRGAGPFSRSPHVLDSRCAREVTREGGRIPDLRCDNNPIAQQRWKPTFGAAQG